MALVIRNERKVGENASAGNRVAFLVQKSFLSVAIPYRNLCANAQKGRETLGFLPLCGQISTNRSDCDRCATAARPDYGSCRSVHRRTLSILPGVVSVEQGEESTEATETTETTEATEITVAIHSRSLTCGTIPQMTDS